MTENFTYNVIVENIISIISEALRIDPSRFNLESRLFNDLNAESLDILDIRFRIEHAFGFKIEDGEIIRSIGEQVDVNLFKEVFTVQRLVDFVRERLTQTSQVI